MGKIANIADMVGTYSEHLNPLVDPKRPKPVLLIDMDGVIADYYKGFLMKWMERYPNERVIWPQDLTNFYLEEAYPKEFHTITRNLTLETGFFENLPVVYGSILALQAILHAGYFEPFLCTAPDLEAENQGCYSEKARWIEKYLGKEWLKRLIITKDKTMVHGDYLIDDKPNITGHMKPSWHQVVFDHAYNKDTPGFRLHSWDIEDWVNTQTEILADYYGTEAKSEQIMSCTEPSPDFALPTTFQLGVVNESVGQQGN